MDDSRVHAAPTLFRLLGLSVLAAMGWFVLSVVFCWSSSARAAEPSPLGDVTSGLSSLVGGVAEVTTPVVEQVVAPVAAPPVRAVAPVVQAVVPVVTPVVAPVVAAAAPVTAPVTTAVAPVVAPVTSVVAPVVAPVTTVIAPVTAPLAPVLHPVVAPLTPAVDAVLPGVPVVAPVAPLVHAPEAAGDANTAHFIGAADDATEASASSRSAARGADSSLSASGQRFAAPAAVAPAHALPAEPLPVPTPQDLPAVAPASGGTSSSSAGSPLAAIIPLSSLLPPRSIAVGDTSPGDIPPAAPTFDTDTSPD
jgi:hypothetical protein